jgi:hypothetical protein
MQRLSADGGSRLTWKPVTIRVATSIAKVSQCRQADDVGESMVDPAPALAAGSP